MTSSSAYRLDPGVKLPLAFKQRLKLINAAYIKSKDYDAYLDQLGALFGVKRPVVSDRARWYLSGFTVGEGCLCFSVSRQKHGRFGISFRVAYSLTQHVNGFNSLYLAMVVFGSGRLDVKSSSLATLSYVVEAKGVEHSVMPFYETYVVPFASDTLRLRVKRIKRAQALLKAGAHKRQDSLFEQVIPLWDVLRIQRTHAHRAFDGAEDLKAYVLDRLRDDDSV